MPAEGRIQSTSLTAAHLHEASAFTENVNESPPAAMALVDDGLTS